MHVLLEDYDAFVQLVPVGVSGPLPLGLPEDLCWGELSSPSLPPTTAD
jgi:hypothetical protein